jgi:hypothetical protein
MTDKIGLVTLPILSLHDFAGKNITLEGVCSSRAEVDAIRKIFRHVTAARVIGLVGGKEIFEDITQSLENVQYCTFDAEDVLDGYYLLRGLNFGSEGGRPGHYPFSISVWFIETESITLENLGKTQGEAVVIYTDLNPLLYKAGVTAYLKSSHLIYEDDETFWSSYGTGSGSYGATVSEETTIRVSKTSSLKIVAGAGSYTDVGARHVWATARDWTGREYLELYLYGANTGLTVRVIVVTDGSNYQYWQTTDNFTGWRLFSFDLDTPTFEQGTFNPASVTEIGILYYAVAGAFTVYTDRWQLIEEHEVTPDAFSVDYERGGFTFTLNGEPVMWAWSYNGNTTVYTGETVDINDASVSDVTLPPIQVTTVSDAIYIGGDAFPDGLIFTIGTAGVYSGITLDWQYWDGDSWESLVVTKDETDFCKNVGTTLRVEWDKPSDFEPSVVNGEEAYWIRCVVTAFGGSPSITTAPLGTQGWLFLEKTAKASYEHINE